MKYWERWNLWSWRKVTPPNEGRVGEDKTHPILGNEGTTLKNGTNIQSDISKQNSDIEPESLLKIKCENDLITPRQIIDPITAINPKIKGGYSFVHVVSMVNHGFNEAQSQKHQGIKEVFNHESEK